MKPTRTISLSLAAFLAGSFSAIAQSGGPYRLNWHTMDGGGGRCAGGAFAMHGTIGQPESGEELRSDLPTLAGAFESAGSEALAEPVYVVRGGFWPGVVQNEVGPRLNIDFDYPFSRVMLTWPYPSPGFVLQQTANFNSQGGGWTTLPMAPLPVGTNWQVNIRTTNSARMYRLIKQ